VTIRYHRDLEQGTEEWLAARCGLITASEMKLLISPTNRKPADNDKTRAHVWELAAQRITRHVEPTYISDDMLRGRDDELLARALYAEHFGPVAEVGFITNDRWGFTLGYSPDGLVGDDGLIECKSRRQRFQVETVARGEPPAEYLVQIQTGLLVTERRWCDFVSYSGGLPLFVCRVEADPDMQAAILAAAEAAEDRIADAMTNYRASLAGLRKVIPTERRVAEEMII
jgi:predicted phage-related endonuclease